MAGNQKPTYEELEAKARELEEENKALRSLNLQIREETQKLERRILDNVNNLVLPYMKRLKETPLDMDQLIFANVLEANLAEIMTPFMRQLGPKYAMLTPREIEVADLVRMGTTSKEIARLLGISKRAVEFHRDRLRKKLGLNKSKWNLRAYLASLT